MQQLLREIQSGEFAKQWIAEHEAGRPNFTRLMQQDDRHQIEQVGAQLRAMMPWIGAGNQQTAVSSKQKATTRANTRKRLVTRSRG